MTVLQGLAALPVSYQAGIGVGIFIIAALCIVVSIISARMMGYSVCLFKRKKTAYEEWNEWYEQREKEVAVKPDGTAMTKEERLERVRSEYFGKSAAPAPLRRTLMDPDGHSLEMGAIAPKRLVANTAAEASKTIHFDTRGSNAGLDQVESHELYERDRSLTQVIRDLKDQQMHQAAILAALENEVALNSDLSNGQTLNPMTRPMTMPQKGKGKSHSVFGEFNPLALGAAAGAAKIVKDGKLLQFLSFHRHPS